MLMKMILSFFLSVFLALAATEGLAKEFHIESKEVSDPETCLDILGIHYRILNMKRKEITEEWLGSLDPCQERPTAEASKILETNFDLTPESSEKDYKKVAKFLKKVNAGPGGLATFFMVAAGGVGGAIAANKATPKTKGDAFAEYLLGYIYANGLAGKIDFDKAKKYLKISAGKDYPQARELLAQIEGSAPKN